MKISLVDRRIPTCVLALINIGIMFSYSLCQSSCRYLTGNLWGLDLKYLGILFMALVLLLVVLNRPVFYLTLLAAGVGGEAYLIGYQFSTGIYCPFCLAFGVIVILMFAINFDRTKIPLTVIAASLGLLFLTFTFKGAVTPAYGEERELTSFGSGPIKVRLYTDYYCLPCRTAEPEIESLLTKLLEKKVIRLTLIDTPFHPEGRLYPRYFLYLLNNYEHTFARALQLRSALYGAARQNIQTGEAIETFLKARKLKLKPFDVTPFFSLFSEHLRRDNIQSTPTCIVEGAKGKEVFVGGPDVIKALKALLVQK